MEIDYISKAGTVSFGGGGDFPFRLTDIDGLWLTGRSFTTTTYTGMPGQTITGITEAARTITLGGDLQLDRDMPGLAISTALTILHAPGELIFYHPDRVFKIRCHCSAADRGERNGVYQKYVFQFLCEDPYFSDIQSTVKPLYAITGLLNADFTYPGMFSTSIIGGSLYYTGTAQTEPIIRIHIHNMPEAYPENGFWIENQTTGQQIGLDYLPKNGDVITIDIPERTIYLADGTNLIRYITDGTFLNGFTLVPGENVLKVRSFNVTADAYMECEYKNKYLEGAW